VERNDLERRVKKGVWTSEEWGRGTQDKPSEDENHGKNITKKEGTTDKIEKHVLKKICF